MKYRVEFVGNYENLLEGQTSGGAADLSNLVLTTLGEGWKDVRRQGLRLELTWELELKPLHKARTLINVPKEVSSTSYKKTKTHVISFILGLGREKQKSLLSLYF